MLSTRAVAKGWAAGCLLTLTDLLTLEVLGAIEVTVERSVAKAAGSGGGGLMIIINSINYSF